MLRADPKERVSLEEVRKVLETEFWSILVTYMIYIPDHLEDLEKIKNKNEEEKKSEDANSEIALFRGNHIRTIIEHTSTVYCLQTLSINEFSSGSGDNSIKIWNSKTGNCIKTLTGQTNEIRCLQLMPTSELVSGSTDKTI